MTERKKPRERKHTYPPDYPPGSHWAITASWEILDVLDPGVLNQDQRAYLAGMIAGKLTRERYRAVLIAKAGRNPQIAEAIQNGP